MNTNNEQPIASDAIGNQNPLPSAFRIGEKVNVQMFDAGALKNGEVVKVHFSESKVTYDLQFHVKEDSYTRIHNIDSVFIEAI